MEKLVQKSVTFCDECEKESYTHNCLICGKGYCFECRTQHIIEFHHAVFFTGSKDGYYCNTCLNTSIPKEHRAKLAAYRTIAALRVEYSAWCEAFNIRATAAEAALKRID